MLGLIVVVMTAISLSTSGASMNPARSFGVAVVSTVSNHYLLGRTVLGCIVAGILFKYLGAFVVAQGDEDEEDEDHHDLLHREQDEE